jgi:hypothetical protein
MTKSEFLAQFKKDGHLNILKAIENEVINSIRIHTAPITSDKDLIKPNKLGETGQIKEMASKQFSCPTSRNLFTHGNSLTT